MKNIIKHENITLELRNGNLLKAEIEKIENDGMIGRV